MNAKDKGLVVEDDSDEDYMDDKDVEDDKDGKARPAGTIAPKA